METTEVFARIEVVSYEVKENVIRIAEEASSSTDLANIFRYYDEEQDVMYCASGSEEGFCVSVSDSGVEPNASILDFLIEKYGEPNSLFVRESTIDPGKTIFYMTWKRVIH